MTEVRCGVQAPRGPSEKTNNGLFNTDEGHCPKRLYILNLKFSYLYFKVISLLGNNDDYPISNICNISFARYKQRKLEPLVTRDLLQPFFVFWRIFSRAIMY